MDGRQPEGSHADMPNERERTLQIASEVLARVKDRPLAAFALGVLCAAAWMQGKQPAVTTMWQAEDVQNEEQLCEFIEACCSSSKDSDN